MLDRKTMSLDIINITSDMSIQDAINIADMGSTIILSAGEYTGVGNNNIQVNKENLTIKAVEEGKVIINPQGTKNAVFNIKCDNTTLENLIIKGVTCISGAVLISSKNNTIKKCTFIDNTSEGAGAIFNDDGDLNVIDSTFTNNKAEITGAIFNDNGNLNVIDSTFTNNKAEFGGAILSDGGI
ncbi:MAG: hypothetical protein LBT10_02220 [Methanobrevibacter sp.]|jgi:predicted outer membrane repeat protein|nr:hypothetical protein [Methanobrevibacter sp.]